MESEAQAVEPIVIGEFQKNKKEIVRIAFTEYQGNQLIDIRAFYPTADGMKAGKGISLQRTQIVSLRKALQQAEKCLKAEPLPAAPPPEHEDDANQS